VRKSLEQVMATLGHGRGAKAMHHGSHESEQGTVGKRELHGNAAFMCQSDESLSEEAQEFHGH